jgi:hypothetical protein
MKEWMESGREGKSGVEMASLRVGPYTMTQRVAFPDGFPVAYIPYTTCGPILTSTFMNLELNE